MNKERIRAKYAARKCENQIEFEHIMQDINEEQAHLNHPYIDREREIDEPTRGLCKKGS